MKSRNSSRQTLLHFLRIPPSQSGAASLSYGNFSLKRSIKCKSFHDIGKSSPYSKRHRNAQGTTIYIGTDAPRHFLTQNDFLSQSSTKAPSEEYKKFHRRYKHVALDRLDIVYLKSRGIEHSSLILLYSSQVSVLVASSGEHFLNGSIERNTALITNMPVKTWPANYNMSRKM